MAYRIQLSGVDQVFRSAREGLPQFVGDLVRDTADIVVQRAKQNVSGVPFDSETGTHTIHKRSGKLAGSIAYQHPYGSPFRARIYASAMTRYNGNPEEWDYAAILEYGRGEVRPKYTPSMRAGRPGRARLAIPGGPHFLTSGVGGFRGTSGNYMFVKSLPPMEGRYWMKAAAEASQPDIEALVQERVQDYLAGSR